MNAPQTQNPVIGFITTVLALITGKLPEIKMVSNVTDSYMYVDPAVQDLITFYFSNIAFGVSIIVGVFTAISWMRKQRKNHAKQTN